MTHSKGKQGFASMHPDVQRKIASRGGKVAQERGTAHQWNSDEARAAGIKGGKSHSKEHMKRIGSIGGKLRWMGKNSTLKK